MRIFGALLLSATIVGLATGLFIGHDVTAVFVVLPIAVATALLLGYPTHLLLRRLGWLRLWQLTLAGAVITSPWIILAPRELGLWTLLIFTGAAAGGIFWWAGVSESPQVPGAGA